MWAADVWMASHQQRSRAVTWVAQGEGGKRRGDPLSPWRSESLPWATHADKGRSQNEKGRVHSGVNLVPITKEPGQSGHKPIVWWLICHRGCDGLRLLIDTKDVGLDRPGHRCHQRPGSGHWTLGLSGCSPCYLHHFLSRGRAGKKLLHFLFSESKVSFRENVLLLL